MDYQRLYDELVRKAQSESRVKDKGETYYEAHHIIPKCMGGEGKTSQWRWHPNIVLLTAREHFMAHYYLTKTHPDNLRLAFAFWRMCNQQSISQKRNYLNLGDFATMYVEARETFSKALSAVSKGKTLSEETRTRISTAKKGKKQSAQTIANRVAALKGQVRGPHSKETKVKISTAKCKPINQYDLEGNFLRTWESGIAAAKALRINGGDISNCLRNRQKTAGGYVWKYF
jgi:hypothetical protein